MDSKHPGAGGERGCDVCGRSPIAGVASSSMGAISWAFCSECVSKPAEPECMFELTYETCGNDVADWVKSIFTWKDGSYVGWSDWVALTNSTDTAGGGE